MTLQKATCDFIEGARKPQQVHDGDERTGGNGWAVFGASCTVALFAAGFEMLPLRLDDNLTIPIFVGFVVWSVAALFKISLA